MTDNFTSLPKGATVPPKPFNIEIPESLLTELSNLLKVSKLAKSVYENTTEDAYFGVSRKWIENAKAKWLNEFNWRKHEEYMNSFPNYTIPISIETSQTLVIHFVALFSEKSDAIPLMLLHGWPGSFLEFLPILSLLKDQYTSESLPYHVIIPSLPGYAFSQKPPLNRNWDLGDVAAVFDRLMSNLGFGDGYVVQGGDVGSKVARILGVKYQGCKAVHTNFCPVFAAPANAKGDLDDQDIKYTEQIKKFGKSSGAYAAMHSTRPSTIGLILSSSPLALLAWIGEKFIEWSDQTPSLDTILADISLYWLTDSFPSSIYSYRQSFLPLEDNIGAWDHPNWYIPKPYGFSAFPKEIIPTPKPWLETTGNLKFYRRHDAGGHFAALEQPQLLLRDVEEFIAMVWKK